jgi:shikimate dehydrogenase
MKLYGLIGFPLSHSFSKKYFTKKFEQEGFKQCAYENFPIPVIEELNKIISLPGLSGLNVTIPYKEQVIPYLHKTSGIVNKIGACNCIKIVNGKLIGYNTDVTGFENSLSLKLNTAIHKQALILGTGGSAKAVKYVLEKKSIKFQSVSRKPSALNLSYEQVTEEVIRTHQLIINTTPLGLFPNIIEAPSIPYKFITQEHYLFDLIYNPEKTLFLKKGEENDALIQNGYEMLVQQAEENWKIWNSNEEDIKQ